MGIICFDFRQSQDNYGAVVNKVSVGSRPGLGIASLSLGWSSDFLAVLDRHVLWDFDVTGACWRGLQLTVLYRSERIYQRMGYCAVVANF